MTESHNNQYASQPLSGNLFIRWLKRLRALWIQPRRLKQWGEGSRITRPYRFVVPARIAIGERCVIGPDCLFQPIEGYLAQHFSPEIRVGNDCYIGPSSQFHCVNAIALGNGCVLSDQVYVSDVGHGMDPRAGLIMDQALSSKGPVILGDGCFVGFGATLLSGVQLGDHCVVGARSVVTRCFESHTMIAGNPARAIARFDLTVGKWVRLAHEMTRVEP